MQNNKKLALICAKAAIDKKAERSMILDVSDLGAFADFFLITSGTNERQVQAIADEVIRAAKENELGTPKIEGYEEGRWILLDFSDVVVHIFHDYIREYYNLEKLWKDAPKIQIPQEYYTTNPALTSSTLT